MRIDLWRADNRGGWLESNLKGEEMFGQTEGARARVHVYIYIYIVQAGVQALEKDLPTIHAHTKH